MEKKETIKEYKIKDTLDIEKIYNNFYSYVYTIVVNTAKQYLQEDIEEIIVDNKEILEIAKK